MKSLEQDPHVERIVVIIFVACVAPLVAGSMLSEVQVWLRRHQVVVPADRASVVLPGGISLDTPRLCLAMFVLLAAVGMLMAWSGIRAMRQEAS